MEAVLPYRIALILGIVGIVALLFVIAALFTSLTEESLELSSTAPVPLGTGQFRLTVEGITRSTALPVDSEIEIFTDGRLFLEDLIKEIAAAEHSVTITNYIFKEGRMSNDTFDALIKAAERGVAVRLLLDAIGGMKAPEDKLRELEAGGGKVEFFRPTNFRSLTRIHRRTHVRAIVIDGKTGYTGGLAFQDEWYGDGTREKEWRDLMFKYSGNLAKATQDQFNGLWRQTHGEILTGKAFYPEAANGSTDKTDAYFVSLLHTPAPDVSADLLDLIWLSITGAQNYLYLATPYLTPPDEIVEALKDAVERGVTVAVIVPGPNTDSSLVQSASRAYYEELLEAGVRIYEYQPGRFHSKWLTADGHWSLIGSPNMDSRSATLNVENIFGIEDKRLALALEAEFTENKENAKEVLLEDFRPNLFKRIYYRLIALFAKQF
jgi:cardiolipin synthase A/B